MKAELDIPGHIPPGEGDSQITKSLGACDAFPGYLVGCLVKCSRAGAFVLPFRVLSGQKYDGI